MQQTIYRKHLVRRKDFMRGEGSQCTCRSVWKKERSERKGVLTNPLATIEAYAEADRKKEEWEQKSERARRKGN